MAARGKRWENRGRAGFVVLTVVVALGAALACVQPAQADDAAGAPATDATSAADTSSTAAAEPAAPAASDPEPAPTQAPPDSDPAAPEASPSSTEPQPSNESQSSNEPAPSSESTSASPDPAPSTGGSDEVVTMEPEDSTAAPAAGNEPACAGSSSSLQPATDGTAAAAAPPACPQQAGPPPPSAAAPTVVPQTTTPAPAQPAAAPETIVVVVSLAPEDSVATPADDAGAAAGLEDPATETAAVASFATAAVELAQPTLQVTSFVLGERAQAEFLPALGLAPLAPPLATLLPFFPSASATMSAAALSQEARAAPRERDGHRATAAKAEQTALPATVDAPGPLEDQGPGTSGGSAGGSAGGASSVRFFAIATTPLRFDFPSSFSHSPLPSTAPEGALEDAPTTRPG